MQTSSVFIGIALLVSAAGCKAEITGSETPCEKVCRRVGEAEAACAPADCVPTCEEPLPSCDEENRAYVACLADAQLLGCLNHEEPTALGECDTQQSALAECLTNGGGSNGDSDDDDDSDDGDDESTSASEDSGDTAPAEESEGSSGGGGPCDPLDAECVACGDATCGSPEACCWGATPECGDATGCAAMPTSTCDGAEDCAGAECCVEMSVSGLDGSVSTGAAACTGGGGSVCCAATPGVTGCAAEPDVQTCVCNYDDYCCTTEWDAQCTGYIETLGCGTCGAGCELTNGSTGTGSFIRSLVCRTSADCAGVAGEFGVPYGMCCSGTNFGVGACVSETYAYSIMDAGGSCT